MFEEHRESIAQTSQELSVSQNVRDAIDQLRNRLQLTPNLQNDANRLQPKFKILFSAYGIYGKYVIIDFLEKKKKYADSGLFQKLKIQGGRVKDLTIVPVLIWMMR